MNLAWLIENKKSNFVSFDVHSFLDDVGDTGLFSYVCLASPHM